MREITGGVTAAKGYQAAGLRAGIKPGKTNKDMAMVYSQAPAVCAGTFTRNIVKAATYNALFIELIAKMAYADHWKLDTLWKELENTVP